MISKTFNIDFDQTTIISTNLTADIGSERVLKKLVANGHRLILFTCRSNIPYKRPDGITDYNGLDMAVQWFKDREIPLFGIQINPEQHLITDSNKSLADYMIDDTALGIPLLFNPDLSSKPFVNWIEIEILLKQKGLI